MVSRAANMAVQWTARAGPLCDAFGIWAFKSWAKSQRALAAADRRRYTKNIIPKRYLQMDYLYYYFDESGNSGSSFLDYHQPTYIKHPGSLTRQDTY